MTARARVGASRRDAIALGLVLGATRACGRGAEAADASRSRGGAKAAAARSPRAQAREGEGREAGGRRRGKQVAAGRSPGRGCAPRWPARTTRRRSRRPSRWARRARRNAAEPLAELLAAGAAPARTEAALDALAKLGARGRADRAARVRRARPLHRPPRAGAAPARRQGAGHDQGSARRSPTLLARLGDAAPGVRAAAGEALAARHERTATPRLFALVKRGDAGAAEPAGRAGDARPDPADRGAGRHRRRRRAGDDAGRVRTARRRARPPAPGRACARSRSWRGAAATTALVEYIASVPAKDDRPSKREAQKLLDERETAQ